MNANDDSMYRKFVRDDALIEHVYGRRINITNQYFSITRYDYELNGKRGRKDNCEYNK